MSRRYAPKHARRDEAGSITGKTLVSSVKQAQLAPFATKVAMVLCTTIGITLVPVLSNAAYAQSPTSTAVLNVQNGTSQNGWPASSNPANIDVITYAIPGTGEKVELARSAGPLLVNLAYEFNLRVQRIAGKPFDEWSYEYRAIRGYQFLLSNHASGSALDINAVRHPMGAHNTFTLREIAIIKRLCAERGIRWGGSFYGRKDEMHFEMMISPAAARALQRKLGIADDGTYLNGSRHVQIGSYGSDRPRRVSPRATPHVSSTPKPRVAVPRPPKVIHLPTPVIPQVTLPAVGQPSQPLPAALATVPVPTVVLPSFNQPGQPVPEGLIQAADQPAAPSPGVGTTSLDPRSALFAPVAIDSVAIVPETVAATTLSALADSTVVAPAAGSASPGSSTEAAATPTPIDAAATPVVAVPATTDSSLASLADAPTVPPSLPMPGTNQIPVNPDNSIQGIIDAKGAVIVRLPYTGPTPPAPPVHLPFNPKTTKVIRVPVKTAPVVSSRLSVPQQAKAIIAHCQQYLPEFMAAQKVHHLLQLSSLVGVGSTETNCTNEKERGGGFGGRGIFQIDEHWHHPWLMLHDDGMDPASNIMEGARILESDLKHFLAKGYSPKKALFAAYAAYNAGVDGAENGIARYGDPDSGTTDHYASRVAAAAVKLAFINDTRVQQQLLNH